MLVVQWVIGKTKCNRTIYCMLDRNGTPYFTLEKAGVTTEPGQMGGYYNLSSMLKIKGLSI